MLPLDKSTSQNKLLWLFYFFPCEKFVPYLWAGQGDAKKKLEFYMFLICQNFNSIKFRKQISANEVCTTFQYRGWSINKFLTEISSYGLINFLLQKKTKKKPKTCLFKFFFTGILLRKKKDNLLPE